MTPLVILTLAAYAVAAPQSLDTSTVDTITEVKPANTYIVPTTKEKEDLELYQVLDEALEELKHMITALKGKYNADDENKDSTIRTSTERTDSLAEDTRATSITEPEEQ